MALTGTLHDLGIIDLVQFPVTAKKTGELIVAGVEDEARLYYCDGTLQHIVCGEQLGMEGLVSLISWIEGEFEFRQGVTTDTTSVTMSVGELLERAEQERDAIQAAKEKALLEHKAQEKRLTKESIEYDDGNVTAPQEVVSEMNEAAVLIIQNAMTTAALKLDYVEHAALYNHERKMICQFNREAPDEMQAALIEEVAALFGAHPRPGLHKIYLTDAKGTSIATMVNDALVLLISANDLSSLGMVSVASTKIASAILECAN